MSGAGRRGMAPTRCCGEANTPPYRVRLGVPSQPPSQNSIGSHPRTERTRAQEVPYLTWIRAAQRHLTPLQAATCPDSRARTVPSNLSEPCQLPGPLRSIIGASAGLGALSSSTYERIAGFSISPRGLDEGPPVRVGVAGPARPPGRGCRTPRRGSADRQKLVHRRTGELRGSLYWENRNSQPNSIREKKGGGEYKGGLPHHNI